MSRDTQQALASGWLCLLGMGILTVAARFSYGMWLVLTLPLMATGAFLALRIFDHACRI